MKPIIKKQLLDELYSHAQIKIAMPVEKKLQNVRDILELLGNPQLSFKSFHITGTKGKGSTAFYLQQSLMAYDLNVGLFTSPHMFSELERIRINNENISWEELKIHLDIILKLIKKHNMSIGFFDILTIASFLYFREKKVDYAVVEVGVGAQFDPTITLSPIASIVTTIGIDHTELLGNTIEEISKTKSYIIRSKTPIFINDQTQSIIKIFQERAKSLNSPFIISYADEDICKNCQKLPVFQHQNLSLVKTVLKYHGFKLLPFKQIRSLQIPGRFQKIGNYLLDIAHNPLSIEILINEYIRLAEDPTKKTVVIFYTKPQKDFETMLNLFPKNWILYFFDLKDPYITQKHPVHSNDFDSSIKIIKTLNILKEYDERHYQFLVTGSFMIVKKILKLLKKTN